MAVCARCLTVMKMPQFECPSCKTDFCPDCEQDVSRCLSCSTPLARFKMPELENRISFDLGA